MKLLTRRGLLVEDIGTMYLAEPDTDGEKACTLRPLQAAACMRAAAQFFGRRCRPDVDTVRLL
jgi:hypothetical protein